MSQAMLKRRWPAEARPARTSTQAQASCFYDKPLPIISDAQLSRETGKCTGSPKLGLHSTLNTFKSDSRTHTVIPTISVDTSALQAPPHHTHLYSIGGDMHTDIFYTYGAATLGPRRRISGKVSTQHIIAFMDFMEATEKEMALEVKRVKASIRDVQYCVRALKKERQKSTDDRMAAQVTNTVAE